VGKKVEEAVRGNPGTLRELATSWSCSVLIRSISKTSLRTEELYVQASKVVFRLTLSQSFYCD
jgi:hypothetical protein